MLTLGRDAILDRVDAALGAAAIRGAQILWIEGEAGIGKTNLLEKAVRQGQARGMRIRRAKAGELDGRRPFGLMLDLLQLPRTRGTVLPSGTSATDGPQRTGPDLEFYLSELAIEAVERLTASGSCLLVLDDLHWADSVSLYALRRLLIHTVSLPLVIVGSFRPAPRTPELGRLLADAQNPRTQHVPLEPLDSDAVCLLVEMSTGCRVGPALREQLAVAGGNPLFVLEMLDTLWSEGDLQLDGHPGDPNAKRTVDLRTSPHLTSLYETILRRLHFVALEDRDVLKMASVLGHRFQPDHLALIRNQPLSTLLGSLERLLAAGLLTEDGDSLAFRHDLIRDALYANLPQAVTVGLHRDVAEVLARAGAPPALVAEHALRGTVSGDAAAGQLLLKLAHDLSASSPLRAADLLRRVRSLGTLPEELTADLSAELGILLLLAGRVQEGEVACRDALGHPLAPRRRVEVSAALASSLLRRGQAAEARAEALKALTQPGTPSLRDRMQLEGIVALAEFFLGEDTAAQARAQRLATSGIPLGDGALGTRVRVVQALVLASQGRAADAVEQAKAAVRIADRHRTREVQEGNPHLVEAMCLMDTDQFTTAARVLGRGLKIQEEMGASSTLALHQVGLGFVYFWSGQWERALSELETGLALARETGTGWRVAALGLLGVISLATGDPEAAREHLDAGARFLEGGEAPYRTQWWEWARLLFTSESTQPRVNLTWLETIVSEDRIRRDPLVLVPISPTIVRMALAAGERGLAIRLTQAVHALAAKNPDALGIAGSAIATQGLLAEDSDLMDLALDRLSHAGRLLELGLAAEESSVLAARLGQTTRARAHLNTVTDVYRRLGAPEFAQRATKRLTPYLGAFAPGVVSRPRPVYGWDSLTATEYRVVRLVAERRSNPEIARMLEISRRTVETHVSHALAKVELASRVELAEQAARHFHWRLRLEDAHPEQGA